jgi:hypothetical protein
VQIKLIRIIDCFGGIGLQLGIEVHIQIYKVKYLALGQAEGDSVSNVAHGPLFNFLHEILPGRGAILRPVQALWYLR